MFIINWLFFVFIPVVWYYRSGKVQCMRFVINYYFDNICVIYILILAKYRGKRCEPLYVEEVAKKVAELKNISYEEVAKQTSINAEELFKI